mmetsp:Transcript_116463/g.324559  ORF Transcript_116463/g.324559 Transcript_116463/m.324559 type:complete len:304 (+) Transcript_116463:337-1248(+)
MEHRSRDVRFEGAVGLDADDLVPVCVVLPNDQVKTAHGDCPRQRVEDERVGDGREADAGLHPAQELRRWSLEVEGRVHAAQDGVQEGVRRRVRGPEDRHRLNLRLDVPEDEGPDGVLVVKSVCEQELQRDHVGSGRQAEVLDERSAKHMSSLHDHKLHLWRNIRCHVGRVVEPNGHREEEGISLAIGVSHVLHDDGVCFLRETAESLQRDGLVQGDASEDPRHAEEQALHVDLRFDEPRCAPGCNEVLARTAKRVGKLDLEGACQVQDQVLIGNHQDFGYGDCADGHHILSLIRGGFEDCAHR